MWLKPWPPVVFAKKNEPERIFLLQKLQLVYGKVAFSFYQRVKIIFDIKNVK